MRAAREELERQIADWIEERRALGDILLPDSTAEAELLRLLRAAESAPAKHLTDAEARAVLQRVRNRTRERPLPGVHSRRGRSFPRLSLALAAAALLVMLLVLWPRAQDEPPALVVVKRVRFELVDRGRVVSLELTAYGPQTLTQEASNDTTNPSR